MSGMREITCTLFERIPSMTPPKIPLSAATHNLKILHRTSCCDTFFEALDFHIYRYFYSGLKLGYCNCLYLNLLPKQLSRLPLLQNFLARAVTGTRNTEGITPVLKSLHWLKIEQRIHHKIISRTYDLFPYQSTIVPQNTYKY